MGLNAAPISSDLDQSEREEVLRKFRAKRLNILVATDIMARGIDVKEIELVINYEVPGDAEDYVHRVGRTARADTTGIAITLVNQDEQRKFKAIEELIEMEIMKQPPPPAIGPTPDWSPNARRSSGGKGRPGGGKKGGRPFKGKGRPKNTKS